MAKYNYTILDIDPVGLKKVSKEDLGVVNTFEINSKFTPFSNNIEIHVYSLEDTLLYSDYNYTNQSYLQNSETSAGRGATEITVDPVNDLYEIGYPFGGVKVVYNFLDNLYSDSKSGAEFYIEEISKDRKEIRLLTNQITDEDVERYSDEIIDKLTSNSYYDEFFLNFKNNDLLIGLNLKTQEYRDYTSVVVKLYEPLPQQYKAKSVLTIVEKVTESRGFEVQAEVIPDDEKPKLLKGPNFSVEVENIPNGTTPYFNYTELFGYDTSNSYRELNALFNEKSINISIDYSDYAEYIHFSSANERLRNFKYKLDLINSYQESIDSYSAGSTAHSIEYFENQINTILKNFDHYDRHLYFESGSTSWPKVNSTTPYINATGSLTSSWYNAELISTEAFDLNNYNQLLNSVPEYLREDSRNAPYATFIHMIGQHFDNLWVYSKAVTDKYDNDNRLNKGISKELVQDALKNFGVSLYNSNKSISDLFETFTGQFYQPGEEVINTFVTSSNIPTSEDNYRNEVYKRLYHNLPLLLKAKGTERGLRALISSFGIPTDNYITGSFDNHSGLSARIFGGSRTQERYTGPGLSTTSSLDKVRLDDTGSIVSGSTLSKDVSIVKRDDKYIIDAHPINVGYSPTDVLEESLTTIIDTSFNIDDTIGDPRLMYNATYPELKRYSTGYIDGLRPRTYLFSEPTGSGNGVLDPISGSGIIWTNDTGSYIELTDSSASLLSIGDIIQFGTINSISSSFEILHVSSSDTISGSQVVYLDRFINSNIYSIYPNYAINGYSEDTVEVHRLSEKKNDLQDFTRILKFYDNVIFKMVKDFLPARSSISSGIIVRSHELERNKIQLYKPEVIQLENTGSIPVGNITGSDGGAYDYSSNDLSVTAYSSSVMTKFGPIVKYDYYQEEAKYNGELSGSFITVSTRELNLDNRFKYADPNSIQYKVTTVDLGVCDTIFKDPIYDSPTCIPATPTPTPTPTPVPGTPTPTPTVTPTPTPTPTPTVQYTPYNSNGNTNFNSACTQTSNWEYVYYHDGLGTLPEIGDSVYSFSGGIYKLLTTGYYGIGALSDISPEWSIEVSNGRVINKEQCTDIA